MNELKNCPRCGRLFSPQPGSKVCRKCMEAEENEYMKVRKYVRDNPGASVFEVSEATGVEEEKILQFLRDGRLRSKGMTAVLECSRCGKIISEGKYCDECLQELHSQINQVLPTKNVKDDDKQDYRRMREKMYIKDDKDDKQR